LAVGFDGIDGVEYRIGATKVEALNFEYRVSYSHATKLAT